MSEKKMAFEYCGPDKCRYCKHSFEYGGPLKCGYCKHYKPFKDLCTKDRVIPSLPRTIVHVCDVGAEEEKDNGKETGV